jgi:hypothetical protein
MVATTSGNDFSGKNVTEAHAAAAAARFAEMRAKLAAREARIPADRERGEAALRRLMPIAQGHSGQCRFVARFLLGLYNGTRFPFDLTDMRCVDGEIFDDFLDVLRMDFTPLQEVHMYFQSGGAVFEQLAKDYGVVDRQKVREVVKQSALPDGIHYADLRSTRHEYLEAGSI